VDQPTLTMRDTTAPQRHAARATLYSAVAVPFLYPEDERLDALRDEEAREGVRTAAERMGLEGEADALLEAVADASTEAVESAYNALMGVPGEGGTYPVVPYEAHYTTGAEVDKEQRRIATVVGLMEAFGVEPGEDFAERQDHLAAELELMQVVASQRAVARHADDAEAAGRLAEAEATVLEEHLAGFVPSLAHDLREALDAGDGEDSDAEWDADEAGRAVYRAAVNLLEALVERDRATHPDPVEVPTESDAAGAEVRNGV
jgi:TorA maturation chaperone TorD